MSKSATFPAQCHCGAVVFEVELAHGFETVRRCNCSFCRMRGAVMVFGPRSALRLVAGEDKLSEYRFNTRQSAHYFCSVCGIYTFHQRRSDPEQFAINVACIQGVSPFDFNVVEVSDGIHHPQDGGRGGIAGCLIYQPDETS